MRRDHVPPPGDDDPFDASLWDLQDRDELEQRFAMLDARLDQDDPFSDIARALREQRALLDGTAIDSDDDDEDSLVTIERDGSRHELSFEADEDDDSDDESAFEDDEPFAAEIEERCQEALDALESDELTRARELAMEAVRLDDEHPFPMFVLGLIAEQEGDLDTARDMAELSLRTAGTNPDAIGLRAHIHVRQHELGEAEQLLRFGIVHNPDEATLHEGLARVALARGHHDDALRAASVALRLEPGNPGALAVRSAALDEGRDRGALLAALRQGVQLHPEDPYAMVELASIEMEHGNLERARVLLMRAQRLAPHDREIGDVRVLVDHIHDRPLLRPVPGLVRWMHDFPGGLAGFIVGFVIAALPLHALVTLNDAYRVPALLLMTAWGATALYAWVAPAVLTQRLNERAARAGADRLAHELLDPIAALPTIERITESVSLLAAAHDRRRAAEIAALAARRALVHAARPLDASRARAQDISRPLEVLARRLDRPRMRVRSALLLVPGASRLLVALAACIAVAAPMLAPATAVPQLAWHAAALTLLVAAWLVTRVARAFVRDVDDSCIAIRLVTAAPGD